MPESNKYLFFGRIVPERADVTVSSIPIQLDSRRLSISINSSQITAILTAEEEQKNILTLRNEVERATYTISDIFSFTHGYSYTVEITGVVLPNEETMVFGVDVGAIREKHDDEEGRFESYSKILNLYSNESGDYLRRCLKNLRLSMNDPRDTGFFCYRAIEVTRKYMHHKFNIPEKSRSDKAKGWEKMRDELNVKKSKIFLVKDFADEPRHGGLTSISDAERAEVFTVTWEIIDKFKNYLQREHQN